MEEKAASRSTADAPHQAVFPSSPSQAYVRVLIADCDPFDQIKFDKFTDDVLVDFWNDLAALPKNMRQK